MQRPGADYGYAGRHSHARDRGVEEQARGIDAQALHELPRIAAHGTVAQVDAHEAGGPYAHLRTCQRFAFKTEDVMILGA